MQKLLNQFSFIFGKPTGLPPKRSHDHVIPLQQYTLKISVKPYRYLYFQKEEIEKIVEELLSSGMIRPNQSPYSFPILLVRKVEGTWCMFVD